MKRFSLNVALGGLAVAETPDKCHESFMHSCSICCVDPHTAWRNCDGCALRSYYNDRVWALIELEAQDELKDERR